MLCKARRAIAQLVILAMLSGLLPLLAACSPSAAENTIYIDNPHYKNALEQALPSFTFADYIRENHAAIGFYLPERLRCTAATEVYKAQIHALLDHYDAYHWYPQYTAAVVIAIDRDQAADEIASWSDLLRTKATVGISTDSPDLRLIMGAMSHALDNGTSYSNTLALLSAMQREGRLKCNDACAPIQICMDDQAAGLIGQGRHIQIVIPQEGTLCFEKGLLSKTALDFPPDMNGKLRQSGLRPLDGAYNEALYPGAADYARAVPPADYNQMNRLGMSAWRLFRRNVLYTRLYSPADGGESMMFASVFITAVTLWSCAMLSRVMNRRIRTYMAATMVLIVCWVILLLFKWQISISDAFNRYLWYSYYIFQLGLPLMLLRIAGSANQAEDAPPPRWWMAYLLCNLLMLALVFTNDLHMQVFRWDLSVSGWNGAYSYGIGYVLLYCVSIITILSAVVLLLIKGWKSSRRGGVLAAAGFCGCAILYGLLYALRFPPARESDYVMTIGFLALLFLQAAVLSGLIPMNTKYAFLFARSPLSMRITDSGGATVMASAARQSGANVVSKVNPITGGFVIWQEDISEVRALQTRLRETVRELERTNALLANEQKIRRDAETLSARGKIQNELDALLHEKLAELSVLLHAPDSGKDIKNRLVLAGLLLCYTKRSLNLMFREKQNKTVSAVELSAYFTELGDCAKTLGLTCALSPIRMENIGNASAIACYGFLFDGVRFALNSEQRELICHFEAKGDSIVLRLMGQESFQGFRARESASVGSVVLSEDGCLPQAVLTIKGGCRDYA